MNGIALFTNISGAVALVLIAGFIFIALCGWFVEKLEMVFSRMFLKIKRGIVREIGVEIISYAYWFSAYKEAYFFMLALGEHLRDRGFSPSGDTLRDSLILHLKNQEIKVDSTPPKNQ